ncbi:MAG TPA: ATP-binding protein [Bryobacterales bacterium]|nr:ATP-binding protein [Bryobacterales bacterium]
MNRLRNRLIVVFVAATLAPLGVTLWVTASLLERSLSYSPARELDQLSKSLETVGREFYQRARRELKRQAAAGEISPVRYAGADRQSWPAAVEEFWASPETERFVLAGDGGDRLELLERHGAETWVYAMPLGEIRMERLADQYRRARELVEAGQARDLRRGFLYTYVLLAAGIWGAALAVLAFLAHRVSRPIQQLTAGLDQLASGNLAARLDDPRWVAQWGRRDDEIGRAIQAFNHTAAQLQRNRDRLVYLTQLASWQALARKMAHEVKNSLTPIRLTMEEMLARGEGDRAFLEQAAQIVVDEVESLERRVRAFSEFAAEPPVEPGPVDVNALVEERVAFLRTAHPEVTYSLRLDESRPRAYADQDLVKGILTNLFENAAEAAGAGGRILAATSVPGGDASPDKLAIEVHDSGPGIHGRARESLFQPTISFKKRGMGLGLSIARKSALLSGGDIVLVESELGGAGFRVLLPVVSNGVETNPDRR